LMARLFADRIQDKRDMLRQASTRSAVDHIPVAEIDEHVELPELPPPIDAETARSVPRTRASRNVRRRRAIAVAVLGAVALGGIGVWRGRLATEPDALAAGANRPLDDRSTVSVPALAPAAPPPPPSQPSKAVSVVVESIPSGAEVLVAGRPRGTTPCTIELPRAADPITGAVSHVGFNPTVQRVVPTADQKLVLHMQPVAAATKPRAQAKSPARETPVFERFD